MAQKPKKSKKPKKQKKPLTPEQRRAKKRRKEEFQTVFINGKQKRIRREPMIDGLSVDEFIRRNADPIWLHQNEMWEYMEPGPSVEPHEKFEGREHDPDDTVVPF